MAASNFRDSLSLVLAHEGGYVNHPADPGGATNKGVTQKVYDAYRSYHHLKPQTVRKILPSEVSDIYAKNYWKLVRGDSLPCGLDYAVFDFAVNSGVSRATKYLQRSINVEPDGVIGLITLNAIDKLPVDKIEYLIIQYCANRLAFLRQLKTFPVFGRGWTRRVVGAFVGAQERDEGVLDHAVYMHRLKPLPVMPVTIGARADEAPGKAFAPDEAATYPVAPVAYTIGDLRKVAYANDTLAAMIAAG